MDKGLYLINIQKSHITTSWFEDPDDYTRVTETKDIWIVELEVDMNFPWGPLKTRESAKVVHSGNSKVRVRESDYYYSAEEAEDRARKLESKLDAEGYRGGVTYETVDTFKKDQFGPIERTQILSKDIPKQIQGKVTALARAEILRNFWVK